MIWDDHFKSALKLGSYYKTNSMRFRLIVGTPAVVPTGDMGLWESENAHVVEITSHPDCASFPRSAPDAKYKIYGEWTWPLTDWSGSSAPSTGKDISYIYGVGLTAPISMGAARVHPRTFEYTGASLACGLTPWGAQALGRMAIGNMARLQVLPITKESGGYTGSSEGESAMDIAVLEAGAGSSLQWTDVFIGVYMGMKADGEKAVANFSSLLDAAKMKRRVRTGTSIPEAYRWWQGTGHKLKLHRSLSSLMFDEEAEIATMGPGTTPPSPGVTYIWYPYKSGEVDPESKSPTTGAKYLGWGNTAKNSNRKFRPYCTYESGTNPNLDKFYYADQSKATVLDEYHWAMVKDHEGNTSFFTYESVSEHTNGVQLHKCGSDSDNPAPGYSGFHIGGDVVTSFGYGSTFETVCFVHGTPVTELVNTIYIRGYGSMMTAGIFGAQWAGHAYADTEWCPLNVDDIAKNHTLFNNRYAPSESSTWDAVRNAPFRAMFNKSSSNGVSDMNKLTGKWGVFPRFKEGGWSVCTVQGNNSGAAPLFNEVAAIVTERHIESWEWSKREQDTAGVYNKIEYVSTDFDWEKSHPYSGYDTGSLGSPKSIGTTTLTPHYMESALEEVGTNWPQLSTLTINTSDCAAGVIAGNNYELYHEKYLATDFFFVPREECTIRLRGLAFANVEPGDYVHIVIPSPVAPFGGMGPAGTGKSGTQHLLDSSNMIGDLAEFEHADKLAEELNSDQRAHPWFCTSAQKDWLTGRVTLVLSRPTLNKPPTLGKISINDEQLGMPDPHYYHSSTSDWYEF